jgi:PAS domain S-box-containing protein
MSLQIRASDDWLTDGGEMGRLMRAHDWSATQLGPVTDWPHSLKTAVRIILGSRYPMFVWWGRELINLYNDGYVPMLGKRHPAALGKSARVIWSEIWDIVGPQTEAVLYEGQATWNEERLLILERNGYPEEAYFTFSYSPIPGDEDGVGGIFCALTEDTQRVLGKRRLRTLRELSATTTGARAVEQACQSSTAVFDDNPFDLPFAAIYLIDGDAKAARLAGSTRLPEGSLAAPRIVDLADSDHQQTGWPLRRVMETGEPEIVDDLAQRFGNLPGGSWSKSPQSAFVLPIMHSGQRRLAGFLAAGISPLRPFDDDYRGFLDLVAGHVGTGIANATAYEEEKQRAESLAELDRAKTTFFSNVSHEFRTPLTLMLGPVEEMLARSQTELSPAAKDQLELVHRNALRLLRLVNSLLDFSRIEADRVRAVFQPTDLAAFTAELASVFRSALERAGLRLLVDCPALSGPVYVDRDMWEKIVLNLLSNAFKFTFEGEIAVSLRQVGNNAELVIRDTGTGIPADEMPRLFERFHRVENARGRTHEGSGIGLALVQQLVRLHGGSITAESVVEQGSTFTVSVPVGSDHLPLDQIGAGRSPVSTATGAMPYVEEALRWLPDEDHDQRNNRSESPNYQEALRVPAVRTDEDREDDRPRVLVADDNSDMRQYIARLLSEHYRVEAVQDGEAALAVARERPPDLILTDVMMPRLDGFGLLREVRADSRTRNVPVIILSARAGEESRVEGMEAGADDYLSKPFSARELLARVMAHLQMARMRREASEALQLSHARFEALFNATPIGIYLVDADMRIRHVNPKGLPIFGDIEGLVGSDFVEVMHVLWPPKVAEEIVARFRQTLETGEPYHNREFIEERHDRKLREFYDWQIHRISLPDGQYGVVCYFIDISEHILARRELAEADQRKNEFLATLAHELRNPLAPLRNSLQLMKLAQGETDTIEHARTLMERQLGQMVRLIDDLLDVARITSNKIELRTSRVELASIIHHSIDSCRPQIERARHNLHLAIPPEPIYLNADSVRLAQVFSNLLSNSCKYTDPGGDIWLTVNRQGNEVRVSVKDSGLGIPPDQLGSIFEMFSQIDRTLERSQGGLGIGLALVKKLVHLHGGSIEAKSAGQGQGSEFEVRLPVLVDQSPTELPQPPAATTPTMARRILVVDDNRDSAASLSILLRITGNETNIAYDGLQALEVAEQFRPDVVLLDLGLPKLNGYDVARRIREQPWGNDIILVALTGWGQDEDRRKSKEAGFNGHLVKPVEHAALMSLLSELRPSPIGNAP